MCSDANYCSHKTCAVDHSAREIDVFILSEYLWYLRWHHVNYLGKEVVTQPSDDVPAHYLNITS